MEAFMQKWAIIALLDEADEGTEFHYTDFPLHITLAGVFATKKTGKQLSEGLESVLNGLQNFEIIANGRDMFGPEKNIAVTKIKKTTELMQLYSQIYAWLQDLDVKYNSPEYQGQGYVPHVTVQKSAHLSQSETRMVKSVSLIDLFPGGNGYGRKIHKTINLS